MRIRTKFILFQLILISGFIISLLIASIIFFKAHQYKKLEFTSTEALSVLNEFVHQTYMFTKEPVKMDVLWNDWKTSFSRVDYYYSDVLTNSLMDKLGEEVQKRRKSQLWIWNTIKKNEIKYLIDVMEDKEAEAFSRFSGNTGIELTKKKLEINKRTSTKEYYKAIEIISHFNDINYIFDKRVLAPSEIFITHQRQQINNYLQSIHLIIFTIALLIQALAAFMGYWQSVLFSRNIQRLQENISRIAEGNFDLPLEIHTGDEFEEFANHFKMLFQEFWNRIDSMKDMMHDISSYYSEGTDLDNLKNFMLELAIDNTGADAGMLLDIQDGMLKLNNMQGYFPPPIQLPPRVSSKREYVLEWFNSHLIAPGEGVLGEILSYEQSRFIRNNSSRELPDNADPETDLYINSAIFIFLRISGRPLGVLALAFTDRNTEFTDMEYTFMQSYGEFISLTIDNIQKYNELIQSHEINKEIQIAADIQKSLLPEKMPKIKNAEIAAFSDAAKGISGDYYDVFDIGGNRSVIVICDVSGKGVAASLLMIMIRTVIRSISKPEKTASQILTELNRTITGQIGADRFATMSVLILDTEKKVISYSNGAHHPLYILRKNENKYRMFDTDGLPIGIDINASFGHKIIRIEPGDYIIMYTDGLSEARNENGEEMGWERLLRFIARYADRPPKEMVLRVQEYLDNFTGGRQHDDQTFVALKIK